MKFRTEKIENNMKMNHLFFFFFAMQDDSEPQGQNGKK